MLYPMSPKVVELKRKLESFMDGHIYPNEQRCYRRSGTSSDRWKVDPVVEELKPKARAAGLWNLFLPESGHGAGPHQPRIRAALRDHGPRRTGRPRCSTARRPTPATWKCSRATARESSKERWLEAAARRRDPLVLRHDRAGRRVVRRDQHRELASSATATSTSSTAASGGPPARAIRAARSASSWARPIRTAPTATSSSR